MKPTRGVLLGLAGLVVLLASASAFVISQTYRTTGLFYTFTQGHDTATVLAGHNLVNLAMGRDAKSTVAPNQVLALTFACNSSTTNLVEASLVVYDQTAAGVVATIAGVTIFDTVAQSITNTQPANLVRFLAQFQLNPTGNATDGLLGGYLTVAGRLRVNRTTGCPEPVPVRFDHTPQDHAFGDKDVPLAVDPDTEKLNRRTGLAHCVGVIDAIQAGVTNTILIPFGQLSIRDEQP